MNQKGFATIFALCLLMAITFVVMGIQAAEKNHAHESSTELQAEFDLQNAAESALLEAADKVLSGKVTLPVNKNPYVVSNRLNYQRKLISTTKRYDLGTIKVEAWGERVEIHSYEVYYNSDDDSDDSSSKNIAKEVDKNVFWSGTYFFSSAEATNKSTGEKIYRRATAFVKDGDTAINFMELPMSSYKFEK